MVSINSSGQKSVVKPFSVKIPENIQVIKDGNMLKITGQKGELSFSGVEQIGVEVVDGQVKLTRELDSKNVRALHGLIRALLLNAIEGVTNGYSKTLELAGVGYRAAVAGEELTLSVGYSHPVKIKAPKGITFSVVENKIKITGIDKQLVGQIAHSIRAVREPEPYKGKGIKYEGERIRRKAGKAAAKIGGAK